VGKALRAQLADRPASDPVAAFYAARGYRPLWTATGAVSPEAGALVATLNGAAQDDLSPADYRPQALARAVAAANSGKPAALARAEIALSTAYAGYVRDLHHPLPAAEMAFVDPAVPIASQDAGAILAEAARAPSLAAALADATRMNPIYVELRGALAAQRRKGGDSALAERLSLNLERARALPAKLGRRYILVNPAAQTLWLYENGQATDQMRVVVGKPAEPTPAMIGLIRYAVVDPSWNVPPDLARDGVAPKVLAEGPAYLAAHQLQAMSSFAPDATPVPPESVDWAAVASGRLAIRMRQLPGPGNMMGKLKFVLPNPLGVYLHDTPNKALFAGDQRTDSSGCVRLSNAEELATRLFGHPLASDPAAGGGQHVDLTDPVPVYVLYLTAQPGADGRIALYPDVYGRDPWV
ncbi:MAG: L,D-transpeptidase family protein, partial [Caulobacteraceae bacterium]